jgi:ABC-type nitrate/sulfonate/bicarbonate transport system substrate-binding protein
MLPALQAGRIDIVGMATATAAAAVNEGVGYVVASSHTPSFQQRVTNGRKIGSLVALRSDFIREYPQFTQKLVDAFVQARLAVQGATGATVYRLVGSDVQSTFTAGVWATAWSLAQPSIQSTDGGFSTAQVAATLNQLEIDKVITSPSQARALFDSSYVTQAYKDLKTQPPATS